MFPPLLLGSGAPLLPIDSSLSSIAHTSAAKTNSRLGATIVSRCETLSQKID
jgi:hypothetical protein